MSVFNVENYRCDSCGKKVIADIAINKNWVVAIGEVSICFTNKNNVLQMKQVGHYCSKKCFYEIVKEDSESVDESITIVSQDGLLTQDGLASEEF